MQRPTPHQYAILYRAVALVGFGATALLGTLSTTIIAAITAAALFVSSARRWPRHGVAADGNCLQSLPVQSAPSEVGVDAQRTSLNHRLLTAHPVSGLPVRETLLAHMNADGVGILGALALADFEQLTAFDPGLGERIFSLCAARLQQMLPTGRIVAQVDRGHIGFWYPGGDDGAVRAELDAIAYALGAEIVVDGRHIIPQINVRRAPFVADEGLGAGQFIARTLASFAVPSTGVTVERPVADYAALARDRYALEQDLRQAIARRELRLAFQPLIDADRGRVCGAEALLRWDHAHRGPIPPARFIPIMEAMGLANEIGLWVLNAAVREAKSWAGQGLGHLRVAVNVSSLQLERDDLPTLIQRTLERHEVTAAALEIELTESIATSDADHCRQIFQALRAMGVKLAVDDFGTGYSGFSSLRALAFDKIKIDREFVTDVDRRPDSQAICQSIAALGRGLGIRVLAEGVERREEYEWLRRHGCHHFQGYYFAKPIDGGAFAEFAHDRDRLALLLRLDAGPARITERLKA